jgi:hypothetical protein
VLPAPRPKANQRKVAPCQNNARNGTRAERRLPGRQFHPATLTISSQSQFFDLEIVITKADLACRLKGDPAK